MFLRLARVTARKGVCTENTAGLSVSRVNIMHFTHTGNFKLRAFIFSRWHHWCGLFALGAEMNRKKIYYTVVHILRFLFKFLVTLYLAWFLKIL